MKKRLLSLALCLCMVLSPLPATALAAEEPQTPEAPAASEIKPTEIWVDGVNVLALGATAPTGVSYNPNENTLTPDTLTLETTDSEGDLIYANGDLPIELDETTSLTNNGSRESRHFGSW